MKLKNSDLSVWKDALENFEKSNKTKYKITKDMVHRRLRPEPEIIEHILEDLEEKIRHYFNLFRLEKEKRTAAEKTNYYLQEEIAKAYEKLEKNKVHTMKVEGKLKNIKDSQSSLIDTVRRIDLLYIQLDTLVQSFAGVCTQTAIEVVDDGATLEKRKQTISMLLDYIYPCRTLDPRINALYGLLYYQTIGLLTGKYSSPPVPPIPPVVPASTDGWLPPSHIKHSPHKNGKIFKEIRFADMIEENEKEALNRLNSTSENARLSADHKLLSNDTIDAGISGSSDLLGFDIKIGEVEILHKLDNPKIVCVVRYDHESAYSAIQNSKRITKSKIPYELVNGNKYRFNVDSVINLNILPPKKKGVIPKFKIDIHDVRWKALIGTAKCSFISEKTLTKNATWDIFSRTSKTEPEIIGKVFVTVFPYPSKAKLPAETFKLMKYKNTSTTLREMESKDSFNHSQLYSKDIIKSSTYAKINKSSSNSLLIQKGQNLNIKKNNAIPFTPPTKNKQTAFSASTLKPVVKTSNGLNKETIDKVNQTKTKKVVMAPLSPQLNASTLNKKGHKVTFKSYVPKVEKIEQKSTISKDIVNTAKTISPIKHEEKGKSVIQTKGVEGPNSLDVLKKSGNIVEKKNKQVMSNVQMLIKKMGNMNDPNKPKLPISLLKEPIKSKTSLDKEKKDELKSDEENKQESKNKESKEENKIKVKLPYFAKIDMVPKHVTAPEKVSTSNDKVAVKIKNAGIDTKLKIASEGKSNLADLNKVPKTEITKELSKEKVKIINKEEKTSFTEKTISVEKIKISTPKKSSNLKIVGEESLQNKKELNIKKIEPQSIKKSLIKINKSKDIKSTTKLNESDLKTKSLLKIKTPGSIMKKVITTKKITADANLEQNKNELQKKLGNVKDLTKKEGTTELPSKESVLQKEKIEPKLILKTNEKGKSENDMQKSITKSVEKTHLNRNPLLKLLKTRQKEKIQMPLKKTNTPVSPTPTAPNSITPKITKIDSDDIKLKQIIQKAQKKSIFIDKSKVKAIKFKNHEKKRILKKFVAKFKAPPNE